jgi:hypothetical protein
MGGNAFNVKTHDMNGVNAEIDSHNTKLQPDCRPGSPEQAIVYRLEQRHRTTDILQCRYLFQFLKNRRFVRGKYG